MSKGTYAFIDSQNLNLGVKNNVKRRGKLVYRGWKIDYQKFFVYLNEKYMVEKAFLFIGELKGNERMYKSLEEIGYEIVLKPTVIYKSGKVKGNIDAELVLKALLEYKNYKKAIIVSGDGDFYCLIKHLDEKRKLARILIPNSFSFSSLLWKYRSRMDFVNIQKRKLEYKKSGRCSFGNEIPKSSPP